MVNLGLCEINKLLYDILYEQNLEAFDLWNKTKIIRSPDVAFVSTYNSGNPDDDFIDLDALLHNVCISLRDKFRRDDKFDADFEAQYGKLPS